MKKIVLSLFVFCLILGACSNNRPRETWVVASERGDCVGVAPMNCLMVKRQGAANWEFIYQEIEGFTYEPGYEYVIEVSTENVDNPAADQSSVRYIFERQVSKTQTTSENMP